MENKKRSILKAITFRIVATLTTIVLVLIFTHDLALANAIGAIDLISKLLLYYLHERTWENIKWGRKI
jgi:uncharacterized membrane protein